MVSVSSISSASQYGSQQFALQEAKRNAAQATQTAQSLEQQANSAQREADRAQNNASTLAVQADKAQEKVENANKGVAILTTQQSVARLSKDSEQIIVNQQAASAAKSIGASPVVNSQGQVTGRIINTTA